MVNESLVLNAVASAIGSGIGLFLGVRFFIFPFVMRLSEDSFRLGYIYARNRKEETDAKENLNTST